MCVRVCVCVCEEGGDLLISVAKIRYRHDLVRLCVISFIFVLFR